MNLSTLTTTQLRQALTLKEQIETLEQQLAAITGTSVNSVGAASADLGDESVEAGAKKAAPAKRRKRGAVKAAVIDLVKNAGQGGITVKEIAAALGKSYGSISVWFNSTGKKVKQIKKVGPGKYSWLAGVEPAAEAQVDKPKPSVKQAQAKSYGGLRDSITNLLKTHGKSGISVKEIAQNLGTKPGNIYSWFTSTGKKIKAIKKVGPAKYGWVG